MFSYETYTLCLTYVLEMPICLESASVLTLRVLLPCRSLLSKLCIDSGEGREDVLLNSH